MQWIFIGILIAIGFGITIVVVRIFGLTKMGLGHKELTPLSDLLSASWSTFKSAIVPLLIGAVVFGLVLAVAQWGAGRTAERELSLSRLGVDQGRLEELQQRAEAGDESAMQEYLNEMQKIPASPQLAEFTMKAAGLSLILAVIAWIIYSASCAYFLLIATTKERDIGTLFSQSVPHILPLVGMSFWIALRSFIWIPILGIIPAIILLPRMALSQVIFMTETKGVFDSVNASMARTQGYWGKIVGNLIVAGFIAWVAAMIVSIFVGVFFRGTLGLAASAILQMLATSFMLLFVANLTREFPTKA